MVNKLCGSCNHSKPTTQFSKRTNSKDKLQAHCKECQQKRTGKLLKADGNGIIYRIVNPLGEIYIGKTKMDIKYRFSMHYANYKRRLKTLKYIPMLWDSFDTWGIDAHLFEVVVDLGNITQKELKKIETNIIVALKQNGKSLNKNN